MSKIAIFPASGKLGTSITTYLLEIVDPSSIILISRHPSKIPSQYIEAGVTARRADYDSPETLTHAFDDASHLILISYPSIEFKPRFKVRSKIFRIPFPTMAPFPAGQELPLYRWVQRVSRRLISPG